MNRIEKQLRKTQARIAKLKRKQREAAAVRKRNKPVKTRKRSGRPRIDETLIVRAIKLAETRSLPDVALSLGISLKTLANYGVTRKALEAEIG